MPATAAPEVTEVELAIGGMTCAACAARVQARLNKADGVTAAVNLATERAHVTAPAHLSAQDLVAMVEAAGYSACLTGAGLAAGLGHAGGSADEAAVRRLRRRLMLALVFFVPLTDLSIVLSVFPWSRFPGWQWFMVVLAAPVATFLLAGRLYEARARRTAGQAMRDLAAAGAKDVCVLGDDDTEQRIPAGLLRAGQRFVVRPGERIAADGEVTSGQSAVDRSMMTGESVPVDAAAGDAVTGGTIALTGRLVVRADKVGQDTQLAHLIAMVEQAQAGKAGHPAAGGPDLRGVRPVRAGLRGIHPRRMAAGRRRGGPRRQRRTGRADHRLPVRAGPLRPVLADRRQRRHRPGGGGGRRDRRGDQRGAARGQRQAAEFHLRNARAWANASTGTDLASQVDPGFILGPHAFAVP